MISKLTIEHAPAIANIHTQALKGDFLPSLGQNFLEVMYHGLIGKRGIYGFVDIKNNEISGFIVGTKNMNSFFRTAIMSNFLKLSLLLFLQVIRNPAILKKIAETFLYPKKDQGPKAELVVIAIKKQSQGKGLGKKLVRSLESQFKKARINKYKLTVYADKKAVQFYEALKFHRIAGFKLYSREWSIYEKKIN